MSRARRIYAPGEARVKTNGDGTPRSLGEVAVEAVREDWVVEDRWWTSRPLCRRYFELALAGGRIATVFRDLHSGGWHSQRA